MFFLLPNQLRQLDINTPTLISWVFELTDVSHDLVDYFYLAEACETRYFWRTPDASFSLVGIEACQTYFSKTYEEMALYQQTIQQNIVTNKSEFGTGPVILGGFPFDDSVNSQKVWNQLGNGYLFLPKIMLTETHQGQFLTVNVMAESMSDLEDKWQEITHLWQEVVNKKIASSSSDASVEMTEVFVPEWLNTVEQAIDEIKSDSPIKKIVLARELKIESKSPVSVNEVLKNSLAQQENTYFFALELNDVAFVGATPERLLSLSEGVVSTACVAGSIPRGETTVEDDKLGKQLLDDMKNQSEHNIVVDAIEKEMKTITTTLSEKGQPSLLKNRDIQHLFFPFSGQKKADVSFFQAIKTLHPTPALGGEPKELTTKWIKEYEPGCRGLYGAPIGWYAISGEEGEVAVGIRSTLISQNEALLYAGCGIVSDSIPTEELNETRVKFQPMLRAIGGEKSVTSK